MHNELVDNPEYKEIPFIFLSAIADKKLIIERKQRGAGAYLRKPIDEKELLLTVDFHIKKYFEYLKVSQLATVDELTGLNNRRAIIERLNHELSARRYRDVSLIFFDIDHFKEINDSFGHQAGDRILSAIGTIVKTSIRNYDIAGRYGGDEFIVILPDTNLSQALHVAEILRAKIARAKVSYQEQELSASGSFGVASLKDNAEYIERGLNIHKLEELYDIKDVTGIDWNQIEEQKRQVSEILVKMADTALYRAKQVVYKKCAFSSEKYQIFTDQRCPQCNGNDLVTGRNKVVAFEL